MSSEDKARIRSVILERSAAFSLHEWDARFHSTLTSTVGEVVSQNQRNWDSLLPVVMSAYRATEHESTGFSPCRLFLGREMTLPIDLVLGECQSLPDNACTVNDFVTRQEANVKIAFSHVREFSARLATSRAWRYNLRVHPVRFQPEDWVWLYCPRRRAKTKEKWSRYFSGPYKVLEQVGPVLYRVQKTKKSQPKLVYVDKLKRYFGETPVDWGSNPEQMLEPTELELTSFEQEQFRQNVDPAQVCRPKREIRRPARFME